MTDHLSPCTVTFSSDRSCYVYMGALKYISLQFSVCVLIIETCNSRTDVRETSQKRKPLQLSWEAWLDVMNYPRNRERFGA